jgi:hypothetical protein
MKRHKIPRLRLENQKVTRKEEEVPEGDSIIEGFFFLKEEEEVEEER